jgi:hypothetical protein
MSQFDTEIADGLWDGSLPADAPAWCSDVASLIGTARGPASEDELAAEDMIVSRMAEAILAAAAGEASTDDLFPDPVLLDSSDDADLVDADLAFTVVAGPDAGPEPVDPAEAPADGAKVNGTKVNGTAGPALTIVPPVGPEASDASDDPTAVADTTDSDTDTDTSEAGEPTTAAEPATAGGETADGPGKVDRLAASASTPISRARHGRSTKRDRGPRHLAPREEEGTGRLRLVRRVVAVKAVATTTAVAIGITAAAAATGVVVTVVDPPKWPIGSKDESSESTILPPAMTIDLGRPASGGRPAEPPRASPVMQLTCFLDFACPNPVAVVGAETAAAIEELTSTTTGPDRPLSGEGPIATTTSPDDPTDPGPGQQPPATSATTEPPPPTTDTPPTSEEPPPTTEEPPPTTEEPPPTTETPPEETTTSTTDTTVGAEPSALVLTEEG